MSNEIAINSRKPKSFVHRLFIGLIIVMGLDQIMGSITGIVDTQCISYFLKDAGLTAISLTSPIIQIVGIISVIFSAGIELIVAKQLAKGKKEEANKHLSSNIIFIIILGIILGLALFAASIPIAKALSAGKSSSEVITYTSDYLRGFAIGLPFLLFYQAIVAIIFLDNDKKNMTLSMVAIFITNITLDILFARFFTNKAFGIGLATSISFLVASIVTLTHFFSKKSSLKISIKTFKFSCIVESVKTGFVMGFTQFVITLRLYLMNIIILNVGDMSSVPGITGDGLIAAYGIQHNINSIFDLAIAGLIETILMLGGVFYEEEDEKSLNELLGDVIKFIVIVGGILSIIFYFIAPYAASMYSSDRIIVEEATFSMQMMAIALMLRCMASSTLSFLEISKKTILANISTALQSFVFPVSFSAILGFTLGSRGLWCGLLVGYTVYDSSYLIIAFIHSKKIKIDVKTLFYLPKSFGFSEEEMFEREINNIKDVFKLHDDILKFSKKLKINKKDAENLGNAAEELGTLIVLSGFSKNKDVKRKPYASIKVLYKKEGKLMMIRSRDNCEKFDITEKINQIKKGENIDLEIAPSLKILLNISKDIDYSHLLNTNNMIIKF